MMEENYLQNAWCCFPNHQYGQQTTIGTIKHLKNPSLKRSRNTMTNTMCQIIWLFVFLEISISMIKLIDKYFGGFESKSSNFEVIKERPIEKIIERSVLGHKLKDYTLRLDFQVHHQKIFISSEWLIWLCPTEPLV